MEYFQHVSIRSRNKWDLYVLDISIETGASEKKLRDKFARNQDHKETGPSLSVLDLVDFDTDWQYD